MDVDWQGDCPFGSHAGPACRGFPAGSEGQPEEDQQGKGEKAPPGCKAIREGGQTSSQDAIEIGEVVHETDKTGVGGQNSGPPVKGVIHRRKLGF